MAEPIHHSMRRDHRAPRSVVGVLLLAASCMKLDPSPLQTIGPLVAGSTSHDPQYRYSFPARAGTTTLSLYPSGRAACTASPLSGTQQTVGFGETTAYSVIAPGDYYFGSLSLCEPFSVVSGGSYTLTDRGNSLTITSP